MSTEPHLLTERRGHVLVVTMNRPEAKNALSGEMLARMYDAWLELSEDDDLRCGILAGSGGTFCSGMDLKAFAAGRYTVPMAGPMVAAAAVVLFDLGRRLRGRRAADSVRA